MTVIAGTFALVNTVAMWIDHSWSQTAASEISKDDKEMIQIARVVQVASACLQLAVAVALRMNPIWKLPTILCAVVVMMSSLYFEVNNEKIALVFNIAAKVINVGMAVFFTYTSPLALIAIGGSFAAVSVICTRSRIQALN
jgi:hypothetical protein